MSRKIKERQRAYVGRNEKREEPADCYREAQVSEPRIDVNSLNKINVLGQSSSKVSASSSLPKLAGAGRRLDATAMSMRRKGWLEKSMLKLHLS